MVSGFRPQGGFIVREYDDFGALFERETQNRICSCLKQLDQTTIRGPNCQTHSISSIMLLPFCNDCFPYAQGNDDGMFNLRRFAAREFEFIVFEADNFAAFFQIHSMFGKHAYQSR